MYVPGHFALDREASLDAVERIAFAHLIVDPDDGFDVVPMPFLLDRRAETLVGHVARANPIRRHEGRALAVFSGPQGYVSPSWYASKAEHGRVVPTWNYVTIAVHGQLRTFDDGDRLLDVVTRLTDEHEAGTGGTWRVDDAPADYVAAMLRAIVGVELSIERVEGKAKLSQNRSEADIAGVVAALGRTALGAAMRAQED